jgi:hypothetical protein
LSESLRLREPASRLPIWRLVTLSYVDLWRALRAMPILFGCAALIVLAVRVAGQLLPHRLESGPILGTLTDVIQNAVQYFCLTPIMIAIHRFVIRGDVTRSYMVDLGDRAFMPFFSWTMALSILLSLVLGSIELLNLKAGAQHMPSVTLAILIVAYAAVVWLLLRLVVLFPAIAVGAKGASAVHALADTRGHGARLLAIFILAFLPALALGVPITLVLGRGAMIPSSVPFVIGDVVSALMGTFVETLGVVIASHVYMAIGRTVR